MVEDRCINSRQGTAMNLAAQVTVLVGHDECFQGMEGYWMKYHVMATYLDFLIQCKALTCRKDDCNELGDQHSANTKGLGAKPSAHSFLCFHCFLTLR